LVENDSLATIREKIQDKTKEYSDYIFIDKNGDIISKENEKDYNLENICESKTIKIKSLENGNSGINVVLNDSKKFSINCSKSQNLNDVRGLINNNIQEDFLFLDQDGNTVSKSDENEYSVEDILNNESIKIKANNSTTKKPSEEPKKVNDNNMNNKNEISKKKKINYDFSQFEILEKREDLTLYKYSNIPKTSNHKLVYQYFFDKYKAEDYSDAYVVLFCGKTGDGKTTAINAFFNIVKGVQLEDNYRFILITEPKKSKGQAESQTDGVHLYYLKDYNNKPIIIIDSQGYGDTRGKVYDDMVDDAFKFVFSSVIDHINAVFFIVKSNTNRIDTLTKYIFSSVTSLFSGDVTENFIVLATFANKETTKKGPAFAESIQTDADFLDIKKNMNKNWWYAMDSQCILENEKDTLTLYSFEKATELYEEKVKKFKPKGIKKSAEVLNTRMQLKVEVENLNDIFQNLLVEQDNLQEKEKNINDASEKIKIMEQQIRNLESNMSHLKPNELEQKMKELNEELNNKISNLNNQTESKTIKKLNYCDSKCTHCDYCEKNCHYPCDCAFAFFGRCTIFSFFGRECEMCGCEKESHKQDNLYYIFETITMAKNTTEEQEKEKRKNEQEKKKIMEEMDKKKSTKNEFERQKNMLDLNKNQLLKEKNNKEKEKNDIQMKIKDINRQILFIIVKLQNISEKINDIAMNNNHIKNEDEYIDDLMDKMDKMNIKEKEKLEKIKKIKEDHKIFKEAIKIPRETLLKMDDNELAETLKVMIPTKKGNSNN
jgi:hypothetical protein